MTSSSSLSTRRSIALLLALLTACTSIQTVSATPSRLRRHQHQQQPNEESTATATIELSNDYNYNYNEPPPLTQQQHPPTSEKIPTSLIAQQFSPNPYSTHNPLSMVLSGLATLSGIRTTPTSFTTDSAIDSNMNHVADSYNRVYGEFCVYEIGLNKVDPTLYPTMQSVMAMSHHCGEHGFMLELNEVMEAVNRHDDGATTGIGIASSSGGSANRRLPLSGMILHEGYAGAGIISNTLSTFDNVRVVSEHSALTDALSACDTIKNRYKIDDCVEEKERKLVKDVITLLSRTATPSSSNDGAAAAGVVQQEEEHLYLKLSATSTTYLPKLRTLYPNTPWLFLYRTNPDHALTKLLTGKRYTSCKKTKRNPSKTLLTKISTSIELYNHLNLETMSHVQVCALHLSTLIDVATQDYDEGNMGMLVQYDQVFRERKVAVETLLTSILPFLGLQEEISIVSDNNQVEKNVEKIVSLRSNIHNSVKKKKKNGSNQEDDRVWDHDNVEEHGSMEVSEEVGLASRMYLSDSMGNIMRM